MARLVRSLLIGCPFLGAAISPRASAQYTAITLPAITARVEDFATAPATGATADTYIARVNFLRTQPGNANRLWVNDSSGRLYVLDADDKEFHTLLNFNGTAANGGLFPSMYTAGGYSWGLVTFQFHPQYAQTGQPGYGKFYTVHVEIPTADGAAARLPVTTNFAGFNAAGYTTTSVQVSPGTNTSTAVHCVLIEWQDTDVTDYVFTGIARELLRTEGNSRIHPLGDLLFNPLATSSAHADWENLYLAHGDGADGENADATRHANPQSLATLGGKILRINVADPDGAGVQRYGIPAGNPFVATAGARGEIWAFGFRNPHRFSWDIDPATPAVARLLVNDIGFHDAEEVNIVVAGGNYGWAEREGLRASANPPGTSTVALPGNDATLGYMYPVISYPHSDSNNFEFGDAISSGYVYRGSAIPALQGKYVFGDITTARLFYANLSDMDAVNDRNPATVANIGVIDLRWDDPDDSLGAGLLTFDYTGNFSGTFSGGFTATPEDHGLFTIIVDAYRARGGTGVSHLPGGAASTDVGRADVRWAMDASGELFLLSKSDGMIRKLSAASAAVGPSTPNVSRVRATSVNLDWTLPAGAHDAVIVERAPGNSTTWVQLASLASGVLTYSDTTLQPQSDYRFRLKTMSGGVSSAYSGVVQITTQILDTQPPTMPTNLVVVSNSPTTAQVSWTTSTDNLLVAGYRVYRNGVEVGTSQGNTYYDTALQAATTYTYTVAAIDGQDNLSAQTVPVSVTTQLAGVQTRSVTNLQTLTAALNEAAANPSATFTVNLAAGNYPVGSSGLPSITTAGTVIQGPDGNVSAVIDGALRTNGPVFTIAADNVRVVGLEFVNVKRQAFIIQSGADGGSIIGCSIESMSATAAIDGTEVTGWVVAANAITGVVGTAATAEPAIYFRGFTPDVDIVYNLILDCDRAIKVEATPYYTYTGQAWIESNMIADNRTTGFGGAPISVQTISQAYLLHNSVYVRGSYANAIEFINCPSAVTVWNNLSNKAITGINSAAPASSTNHVMALAAWFKDPASCDLRLTGSISGVVNAGTTIQGITIDIEGDARPTGGAFDIGADEYVPPPAPPAPPPTTPPASGGGGGAPSQWFLGALSLLVVARRWRHHCSSTRGSG